MNHKKLSAFIVLSAIIILAVVIGLYANTANNTATQPTVETQKLTPNTNPTIYKVIFKDNESYWLKTVEIYWKPENSSVVVAEITINGEPYEFGSTHEHAEVKLNWQLYTVYVFRLTFDDYETLWYVSTTATPT